MEDKLIIKYIKKGKEEGLSMLLDTYGGVIRGIVKKHLAGLSNFEGECINDILLSIWNNIDSFSGTGSFKSWIGTIAKFKAIDYKRKYLKLNSLENIDDISINDKLNVDDRILREELQLEIYSMLDKLSEEDKEIFIKYYLNDSSISTICTELNLSSTQVYSRLSRGRKKLRQIFSPQI